jgi:hypothetical protein
MIGAHTWEHIRGYCTQALRNPAQLEALLGAAEMVSRVPFEPEPIDADLLRPVLDTLCPLLPLRSRIVSGYAARWLWELASRDRLAIERLRHEFQTGNADARLIIVQSIGFAITRGPLRGPLEREILLAGLKDGSARVRLFAAERCHGTLATPVLRALEEALACERHERTAKSMRNVLDYNLRGFHVSSSPLALGDPSRLSVFLCLPGHRVTGVEVPRDVAEQIGVAEAVLRARARYRDRTIPGDQFDPLPPDKRSLGAWPMQNVDPTEDILFGFDPPR